MNKKNLLFLLLLSSLATPSFSQVGLTQDPDLEKDIYRSGLIHSPLTLNDANSFEANGLKKKVVDTKPVCSMKSIEGWKHHGYGRISHSSHKTISGQGSLKLVYPTFTGKRAQGPPSDPDYATYGNSSIVFDVKDGDWQNYNRIAFYIYPDCEGARVVNMNLSFENKSSSPTGAPQSFSHLINLKNKQWNRCFLDIGEYQRDNVTRIGFSVSLKGKDRTTGDSCIYYIDNIELQQVEDPEIIKGWLPGKSRIVYSTTGYMTDGPKTAILTMDREKHKDRFRLVECTTNQILFEGNITPVKTSTGNFDVIDFSSFKQPGTYRLEAGNLFTPPFRISSRLWEDSQWRVLNFIFCQRCGYPVPGKHGTCHLDLCSRHNEKTISYAGGWHDAGDLSQQTLQTADVTYALLEAYNTLKETNQPLAMRLLEEAEWGLEFVLRNRYGDGYRASSVGLLIWQDGVMGTLDDIHTVRVQNLAFDNFLYSGYEAYAALSMDHDPMLQEYLQRVACEDFDFALKRHKEVGYGEFIHFYEHSYNTSESQYMATISWSASMLYKLTGQKKYADMAAEYIRYTIDCQRKEPLKDKNKTKGFFYRDKSRKSIVHYIHQSREQVYMQAMALLCETQPEHPDFALWKESIGLYGEYIKGMMKYTAPYGMIPSGVYHADEHKDSTSFYRLHLFPPHNAEELYTKQVKQGVPLDKEHYLKRFPVWFSIFNGNTAIHLSTGKAAAICGKFLNDSKLIDIAREQLYWTVGKNPFGQSLIYGEGYNYPQMDSFSSGEMVGEMPVGIRSWENEDIPYWPSANNACYKEVWVTSAGKWLSLIAELTNQ